MGTRRRLAFVLFLSGFLPVPSTLAGGGLTFEQRVADQRAIELVYHEHRIWPAENSRPKPALAEVLSDAAIRDRVSDYLKRSDALAKLWGPLTAESLQAELNRMSRETRAPAVLAELFAALGDDPNRIAETLVRQRLVERTLRERYEADPRSDGEARRGFEEWWSGERDRFEPALPAFEGAYSLVLPQIGDCPEDQWLNFDSETAPINRGGHTAIWTGSEMIVWGGRSDSMTYMLTGGRYDPATDNWRGTSVGTGVPDPRAFHTAVWTGTEMIVWGGGNLTNAFQTGGRYDPVNDSWQPTSTAPGVPAHRLQHTAVWTGSEMIVWGGQGGADLNTGGRYDPSSDSWSPTSTGVNVPAARRLATAVWTGTEMIVWGGLSASSHQTGGRYDPATDSWQPTSLGAEVPFARFAHSAVWTGSQMIVWGGDGFATFQSGGRYDPASDTWQATSTSGAVPSPRRNHTAVWTGAAMVVWGGRNVNGAFSTGSRYYPASNTWQATSSAGVPFPRDSHGAVWTGSEMIVWGGFGVSTSASGGRYDPAADTWNPTFVAPASPAARERHTAVWTGSEMIVWGGQTGASSFTNSGSRYDPATNEWVPTASLAAPPVRARHTATWTGTEMIIWGGLNTSGVLNNGGRYDPAGNLWNPLSLTGGPSARRDHSAVWTGGSLIVWGGVESSSTSTNSGRIYVPATDQWTTVVATLAAPGPRGEHEAVWTGTEMVVWGGFDTALGYVDTGGRYDPGSNTWTPTSASGAPSMRARAASVWTGEELIVWGGDAGASSVLATGARYRPQTDLWVPTSTGAGVPSARTNHTAVWTGSEMIVWGGSDGSATPTNTGGRFDPATDTWAATSEASGVPSAQDLHVAVWTGSTMLVWGGLPFSGEVGAYCAACTDDDADGICSLDDNCRLVANPLQENADADPLGDVCDCAPADPANAPAGPVFGLAFTEPPPDRSTLVWEPASNAASYDVVRGEIPSLPVGPGGGDETCFSGLTSPGLQDDALPSEGFFYVVRGRNDCGAGSYGAGHVNPGPAENGPARATDTCP